MTDGVGSQLHRIYGLYALARALDIKYVHSPLREVGYQGLMPMLTGRTDPDFAARYNAFFSLPSDDFDLEGCERVRVHSLDEATVERYREQAAATGRPVLIRGHLPYEYINQHPAGYQMLRTVSPYRGYRPAGPVRVCIHLRRGDNSVQGREREFPRPCSTPTTCVPAARWSKRCDSLAPPSSSGCTRRYRPGPIPFIRASRGCTSRWTGRR